MFVLNFKPNFKKILIILAVVAIVIALISEGSEIYSNFTSNRYDYIIDETNFTTSLKKIHDDINSNIGKSVKVSGFVFTMPDFKEDYFVCGRNMILNNEEKVVGFLCQYDDVGSLKEGEWIEITGTFVNGFYMASMPVIKIESIKKITAPINSYVNPLQST